MLKKIREEENKPIAILLDTKGPEIRTGVLKDGKKVQLKEGETITLTNDEIDGDETKVSLTYKGLVEDVKSGNTILIDDGLIGLKVKEKTETDIIVQSLMAANSAKKGSQCTERSSQTSGYHRKGP